ncbi:hypothetical protein Patl1_36381 [Pistacia atlantica]|nr:hypothetical protein Patl1_36381 [Pistacia atlantica]
MKIGSGFAACNVFLCLLLFMSTYRSGARETTDILSQSEELIGHNHDAHHHVHAHQSSHMDHMDPSSMVFFTMKDLKKAITMPIYFRVNELSNVFPHLLPREEADSIPFSMEELAFLLRHFSFSKDSTQARAMEHTLKQCENQPIEGEIKLCPTSLESMLDFARSAFSSGTEFKFVNTRRLTKSTTEFQNYTILEVPDQIFAPKMVACHTMPYPYAVFYCHSQETENKVFRVSLVGDNGDRVEAIAVCHMDTSKWSRDHASFRVLGIEPGSSHVCHFFQPDNLIFVPVSSSISNI